MRKTGVIIKKENDSHQITVSYCNTGACASCVQKESCQLGSEKKEIIVTAYTNDDVSIGEEVELYLPPKNLLLGVLFAYLLPLCSLILVLILLIKGLHLNELHAGVLSLGVLVVYFCMLFFFRKSITDKFTIRAYKIR